MSDAQNPVTLTVANSCYLAVGDKVSVGTWPRWMYWLHVPERVRWWLQKWCAKIRLKFGPEVCTVTTVKGGKNENHSYKRTHQKR